MARKVTFADVRASDNFNWVLEALGVHPGKSYIAVHSWPGRRSLEDVFVRDRALFERWQSIQSEHRFRDPKREWLVSCVRHPDDWNCGIFLDVYRIGKATPITDASSVRCELTGKTYTSGYLYDLEAAKLTWLSRCVTLSKFTRYWHPKADSREWKIVELLEQPHDLPLPEVLGFSCDISKLLDTPRSWRHELARARGVYVILIDDDAWYVGKADGEGGFWARWEDYRDSKHGGNKLLKAYLESHSNAQSMVEAVWAAPEQATAYDVLRLEAIWKEKMRRIRKGPCLNGN